MSINIILKSINKKLFIISSVFILFILFFINNSTASEKNIDWQITLNINESGGSGDTVVFGEKNGASNGKDQFDIPKPPTPQIPYIRAWFKTDLEEPYNILWEDYRVLSEDYKVWNLTVIWVSEDRLTTNITISWDISDVLSSRYDIVYFYSPDIIDMKLNNNYKFASSDSERHSFEIILQNKASNVTSDINNIFYTPLLVSIVVIIILIIIIVYIKKKK